MAPAPLYSVCEGPDSRHLINCTIFNRLRDAEAHVNVLSPRRAYKLEKLLFTHQYNPCSDKILLGERVI